jgi:hypothetical protein
VEEKKSCKRVAKVPNLDLEVPMLSGLQGPNRVRAVVEHVRHHVSDGGCAHAHDIDALPDALREGAGVVLLGGRVWSLE